MTDLENFLGVRLRDLPVAEHADSAARADERWHECVMCVDYAVAAFYASWPPPLEHHGYWIDLCGEHAAALRDFVAQNNLDRGL